MCQEEHFQIRRVLVAPTRVGQTSSEDTNGQAFLSRSNSASSTPSTDSTFSNKTPTLSDSNAIEQTEQPSSESVLDLEKPATSAATS